MPNKPRTVPAAQQFAPTLRLVGLAAFAAMASMRVCDAMLLELAREFQVSTGEAARVISFYALAYGAMQLIYGPLSERVGKLPVISCAAALCALLSLLASQAASMDLLVASRVAMGAAAAGIVPLTIAWIGDQVPYERRQETLAKLLGATISGTMAGQWLGGLAADTLGWRAAFVALAGAFGVAALLLLRNTRRDWPARSSNSVPAGAALNQLRGTFELLAAPQVRWVLALTAAEGALAYGAMAFVPSRAG